MSNNGWLLMCNFVMILEVIYPVPVHDWWRGAWFLALCRFVKTLFMIVKPSPWWLHCVYSNKLLMCSRAQSYFLKCSRASTGTKTNIKGPKHNLLKIHRNCRVTIELHIGVISLYFSTHEATRKWSHQVVVYHPWFGEVQPTQCSSQIRNMFM